MWPLKCKVLPFQITVIRESKVCYTHCVIIQFVTVTYQLIHLIIDDTFSFA
jgi:hypothetical protein